jgi:hypothetical protein
MKRLLLMAAGLLVGLFLLTLGAARAQDEKPLAPGWLSLDSSVGILDKAIGDGKGALEKALGISISGFFDTSYTLSTNHPGSIWDRDISGRYFDQDHNDIVFNAFNLTLDKPEKDWGVGFHLAGDFGRAGELLREATYYGKVKFKGAGNGGEPAAELREAFATTTIPLGEGIGVKGGLFVTSLGTEILPNPGAYNENISRSFLFNFAVPLRHVGMLLSYPVHKMLTVSAGPVTGWDDPHPWNSTPSVLWGLNFTPADAFSLASNFIYGPQQLNNGAPKRFTMSHVATIKPFGPLTLFLEYTYGNEDRASPSLRDVSWQGFAAIASYGWTDRLTTALRGEYMKDADGMRTIFSGLFGTSTPRDVGLGEITLTGSYKFTKMLMGRAELRQDWADKKVFALGNSGRADQAQTTIAFQMIYTF